MSVIWSGVTEEGAVVPVQVDETGKVIATAAVPGGAYVKKTGDNMTGDLTLGTDKIALNAAKGSGTFTGNVDIGGNKIYGSWGIEIDSSTADSGTALNVINNSASTAIINQDGTATFAGTVTSGGPLDTGVSAATGAQLYPGTIYVQNKLGFSTAWSSYLGADGNPTSTIFADGSASFAGGKCGFTSAGELFFTSRSTRYKAVVQDQLVIAEPFTRQMELKEKAEQFIADKRETKPSDPSDPDPSDPQSGVSMDIDNSSPNRD